MAKQRETISLVDDEGAEHEFDIVDFIEVDARRYAVLQPRDGGDESVIFRVEDDDTLATVDDDEEFERVTAALRDVEEYDAVEVNGEHDTNNDEDEDDEYEEDDDEELDSDDDDDETDDENEEEEEEEDDDEP